MTSLTDSQYRPLTLAEGRLGSGKEGFIFAISAPAVYAGYCVKLFRSPDTKDRENKLKYLINHPPGQLKTNGFLFCWPTEIAYKDKSFIGFIMPQAPNHSAILYDLCLPKLREATPAALREKFPWNSQEGWDNRLKLCVNIAAAVDGIEKAGVYTLIDFSSRNIHISEKGLLSFYDFNSLQVWDPPNVFYPGYYGSKEYCPPGQGEKPEPDKPIGFSWHRFGLAVLFYQLLMGIHPFAGGWAEPYAGLTTIPQQMREGLFVHGRKMNYRRLDANSLHHRYSLYTQVLQEKFRLALDGEPKERPSAAQWHEALLRELEVGRKDVFAPSIPAITPPPAAKPKKIPVQQPAPLPPEPALPAEKNWFQENWVTLIIIAGVILFILWYLNS